MIRPLVSLLLALALPAQLVAAPLPDEDRAAYAAAFFAAARGDADAQFALGEDYRLGRGVVSDLLVARGWYARAAAQGHAPAAAELGRLLAPGEPAAAAPWLAFAARRGDARALATLAALLFNGDGVARDPGLAYALMFRAAAAGLPEAEERLDEIRAAIPEPQRQAAALLADDPRLDPLGRVAIRPAEPGATRMAAIEPVVSPGGAVAASHLASLLPTTPGPRAAAAQVGAFRSPAAARRAVHLLRLRMRGATPAGLRYVAGAGLVRVQFLVGDRAAAAQLCRAVRGARWSCFVRNV